MSRSAKCARVRLGSANCAQGQRCSACFAPLGWAVSCARGVSTLSRLIRSRFATRCTDGAGGSRLGRATSERGRARASALGDQWSDCPCRPRLPLPSKALAWLLVKVSASTRLCFHVVEASIFCSSQQFRLQVRILPWRGRTRGADWSTPRPSIHSRTSTQLRAGLLRRLGTLVSSISFALPSG